jgi:hypothetical protein
MDYSQYPRPVLEDIVRLRRCMDRLNVPRKLVDRNFIVGTWNIRALSQIHPKWEENTGSPKRNLRALAYIAEIIRRFDVVAIQEVKEDLSGLLLLMEWLGPDWGYIVTDTTAGDVGNNERLTYVFDRRRAQPSGLAGEIVLPPNNNGDPALQFYFLCNKFGSVRLRVRFSLKVGDLFFNFDVFRISFKVNKDGRGL